ncbi:MAG: hypothetical protein IJU41_04775, partial [Clostridia bacterium]|nr:hypothetical protein [Clostridia bacterium]
LACGENEKTRYVRLRKRGQISYRVERSEIYRGGRSRHIAFCMYAKHIAFARAEMRKNRLNQDYLSLLQPVFHFPSLSVLASASLCRRACGFDNILCFPTLSFSET